MRPGEPDGRRPAWWTVVGAATATAVLLVVIGAVLRGPGEPLGDALPSLFVVGLVVAVLLIGLRPTRLVGAGVLLGLLVGVVGVYVVT